MKPKNKNEITVETQCGQFAPDLMQAIAHESQRMLDDGNTFMIIPIIESGVPYIFVVRITSEDHLEDYDGETGKWFDAKALMNNRVTGAMRYFCPKHN